MSASLYSMTLRPESQMANVTAGLKCAPETLPDQENTNYQVQVICEELDLEVTMCGAFS